MHESDFCRRRSWQNAGMADFNQISILTSIGRDAKEDTSTIDDNDGHPSIPTEKAMSAGVDSMTSSDSSKRSLLLSIVVAAFGAAASALFIGFGIAAARKEQDFYFHHLAEELALQVDASWEDYETGSRWLHQACAGQNMSRDEFAHLYEYMMGFLDVKSINWVPKVLHEERAALEEESRSYYAEYYPDIEYKGIRQLRYDSELELGYEIVRRSEKDFYYPAHLVEPVETNDLMLDFDLNSLLFAPQLMERALTTWQPVVSAPFRLFPGTHMECEQNTIMLFHPGIPHFRDATADEPTDLAVLVIDMTSVVNRVLSSLNYDTAAVYLYDYSTEHDTHTFMVAVDLSKDMSDDSYYLAPIGLKELQRSTDNMIEIEDLQISSTTWTLAVVALDGEYEPNKASTIIAGFFIFGACFKVAIWIWWEGRRNRKIQAIRRRADAETAAIKLQSAQDHAKAEQELNDYIAHEIRNPLSAAMSACSFVKSAVNESTPLCDQHSQQATREDVGIIDSSLTFMNDLLRSMLDMHKAASMKIAVSEVPVDLQQDVLHPVACMLYSRDSNFNVRVDCPENLIISIDRLRLKQIVLNLGRNSTKFVQTGFIRLSARIVNDKVRIMVEDSGPGIPAEKMDKLFNKFQESLDVMEQGTGMGLCLCKNMSHLLGGDLWLDESYISGIPGCPGARFVFDTNANPMSIDDCNDYLVRGEDQVTKELMQRSLNDIGGPDAATDEEASTRNDLPEKLSVLFVDDDMVLRKLFSRSVKKVVDTWDIHEAGNGESALKMVAEKEFDLIFMDQYMASTEKTMLGTETIRAMRVNRVKSRICGLSANDMEKKFLASGADFFILKPFPCKPDDLRKELIRIMSERPIGVNKVIRMSSSTTSSVGDSDSTTSSVGDSDSCALEGL